MKRLLGALALTAVIGAAFAQAPFTVVSPRNYNPDTNGPLSREKITVKFPKGSIPSNGYVGIYLGATRGDKVENEKFIEATTLPLVNGSYVYTLDTKARQIADGMYTLRAILYVDYSDRPRELSQTQVNIRVANHSSIKIPDSGLKLRYNFRPGTEVAYSLEIRTAVSTISANQNSLGGRAAELPLEAENLRILYAVDQTYGNGDGLIRMQPLPSRGKDYAWVTIGENPEKYYSYEMGPIYMRMTNTGREVYGAIPAALPSSQFVPLNLTGGRVDLYADFPLPSLPVKSVKPGDSWQTRFLMPRLNLEQRFTTDRVSQPVQARGEFIDVEYEMGHPCAKLRHSITQGMRTTEGLKLTQQGREFSDDKLSLDETVYFALDTHQVLKVVRDYTIDTKEQAGGGGFGTGGNSSGPTGDRDGRPSGGGGTVGSPPGSGLLLPPDNINQRRGGIGTGGGQGGPASTGIGAAGAPGGANPGGNFGGNNGRGSNGPGSQVQYYRYRYQMIFTLEK